MVSYEFKPYPFVAKRYEAELPMMANGVETKRHPVAIVGGGPVGLALALGLANHGVASVVIEADDTVCFGSRAICISRRSLEIVERLGALPAFLEKGLPWTGGRSFYREPRCCTSRCRTTRTRSCRRWSTSSSTTSSSSCSTPPSSAPT